MKQIFDFSELLNRETSNIFHRQLLANIKSNLDTLERKLNFYNTHFEHDFCRAHEGSLKIYPVIPFTEDIVETLRNLSPLENKPIEELFLEIYERSRSIPIEERTGKFWKRDSMNIINAFMHARQFLEYSVKAGKELEIAPGLIPYYWAALLSFYNLR